MMNKYDPSKEGDRRSAGDRRKQPRYILADGHPVINDRRASAGDDVASDALLDPKDVPRSLLSRFRSLWRTR